MARSKNQLKTYRAKRDFDQTPEPSGARAVASSERLRFVIQKHAARRLHYDLRLELDGVFKSWAVTRGPSLNPADKRLAVEVEDHPLDYGDFEGTIPQGQYGGGSVQLWDRGYWQPLPGLDPRQALRAGQLKFTLEGQRLHGSWALVRMRQEGKRVNWLLIKHRDEAATDEASAAALLAEDRSVASGRTMAQIAEGQGRGPTPFMLAGAARARADAVWQSPEAGGAAQAASAAVAPKAPPARAARRRRVRAAVPMPSFIEPQLCRLVEQPPDASGWAHEVKFDGYRVQLHVQDGIAQLRTRKGLDWSERFPPLQRAARELPDGIIDGEVVALNEHGVPSFQALQMQLSGQRAAELIYFAFDLLFSEGEDLRAQPLAVRKQRLHALLDDSKGPIRYVEHFEAPGREVLKSACRMALEGIISKRLDAPYASGRVPTWTKSKCRAGQEVIIGAWTSDEGALRALLVGVHRDGQLVYAGRVGTGFSRETAKMLQTRLNALAAKDSPFTGAGAQQRAAKLHWVRPELIAEIEFAGWTEAGWVRQASFKGLREDKSPAEVTIETAQPTAEVEAAADPQRRRAAAAGAAGAAFITPAPRGASAVTVMSIPISQPDKQLWPDAGDGRPVSKLELARYYESVGEWLIPHIAGRPCSLLRAPDGIGGQQFLQRHVMPGMSDFIDVAHLSGDRKPYVVINRIEGLIAAAQTAALELHPWNCVPNQLDVPGRLVFDLDPAPGVTFDIVIKAALELRERLTALGLESVCKTTGGKGLHVVTPLSSERDPLDWPTAKGFAQAVCAQMAADSPQRYLTTMSKKARAGRIFLDYLRNDRMSTAVAPLSPRARAGAPVSMPLLWSQVRRGLDPHRYTLRSVPALLARSKAWQEYVRAARSLRKAIARLTGTSTRGRARGATQRQRSRARTSAHP